jgi:single-stranded-DNA-specific exonuclease
MKEEFLNFVEQVAEEFLELVGDAKKPVRVIGNLDTDGITSASIICKALSRKKINYSVSIVKQVNDELIKALKNEEYEIVIFTDLASAFVNKINEELESEVFILDHHYPEATEKKVGRVRQINPHIFKVDGTKDVSAAGVAYYFSKALDEKNLDLSYLALVGAIGDMQENMGFRGLNLSILEDAIKGGFVEVKETLRLFGMQTKPIHKVLEYSTNPYIPGVTGNEKEAIKFIEEVGISLYDNAHNFRKLVNLSEQEVDKLVNAINIKKVSGTDDSMVGPVFLLKGEEEGSLKKDLREFSTLLNSCGRMGWPSLGIGVCLGDKKATIKAYDILKNYRKEIIDALNWFYENRRTDKIIEKKGYVVILAESNIRDTIIGTLASLLAKSKVYEDGTVIMSTAYTLDGFIKVSLRITGNSDSNVDLRIIVKEIITDSDGYGGGHKLAAGASIPQEKEDIMVRNALSVLDKFVENKA